MERKGKGSFVGLGGLKRKVKSVETQPSLTICVRQGQLHNCITDGVSYHIRMWGPFFRGRNSSSFPYSVFLIFLSFSESTEANQSQSQVPQRIPAFS